MVAADVAARSNTAIALCDVSVWPIVAALVFEEPGEWDG
jgi:hypothetical protein